MSHSKLLVYTLSLLATTANAADWGDGFNLGGSDVGASSAPARFQISAFGGLSLLSGGVTGVSGFENTLKSSSAATYGGKARFTLGAGSSKAIEVEFIRSSHSFDISGDDVSVTGERAIVRYTDQLFSVGQTKVNLGVGAFLFRQSTNASVASPVFTNVVADGLTLGLFSSTPLSSRFQLDLGAEGWFATSLREFSVETGSLERAIAGRANATLFYRLSDSVRVGTGAWYSFDLRKFNGGGSRGSVNAQENLNQWIVPVVLDVSF